MKLSARQTGLLVFTLLLVGVVLAGYVHHLRVRGAVERYRAELTARGERLTIEECLPPTVPAESNSAELFLSVTTNFVYEGALATIEEIQAHWETEIKENHSRLFKNEPEPDLPYEDWGPMIDPETGDSIRDSETRRTMWAADGKAAGERWAKRVQALAQQWTEQYFRTLTNARSDAGNSPE